MFTLFHVNMYLLSDIVHIPVNLMIVWLMVTRAKILLCNLNSPATTVNNQKPLTNCVHIRIIYNVLYAKGRWSNAISMEDHNYKVPNFTTTGNHWWHIPRYLIHTCNEPPLKCMQSAYLKNNKEKLNSTIFCALLSGCIAFRSCKVNSLKLCNARSHFSECYPVDFLYLVLVYNFLPFII